MNKKMNNPFPSLPSATALLACLLLAACGGGGGGAAPAPTPVASLSYQALVTSVSPFTYTNPSDNLTIATNLNTLRQNTGVGLLAQNSALDTAAKNHADYLVTNSLVNGTYLNTNFSGTLGAHYEDQATYPTGFTGATPQARATAAGYAGSVVEVASFGAATGADCLTSFEDSVYHLADILSAAIDVGVDFANGGAGVCMIELGTPSTTAGQLPASGTVTVYPYDTENSVPPTFYNQAENPVPAPDLLKAGHPVAVSLYSLGGYTSLAASDIVLNTFTLTQGATTITARILDSSAITTTGPAVTPDSNLTKPGFIVLLPESPLSASTTYNVSFSATVKSTPVSKTWSFTTGAAN